MILIWVIFIVAVLGFLWERSKSSYRPPGFPPGPRQLPVIGNLLAFRKSPLRAMSQWTAKYGPIVGLRLGSMRTVLISDYDLLKEAFSKNEFNARPSIPPNFLFTKGVGSGTLLSHGKSWDTVRRFTIKNLHDLGFGRIKMENQHLSDISQLINSIKDDLKTKQNALIDFEYKFSIPITNHVWYMLVGKEIPKELVEKFQNGFINMKRFFWLPIGSAPWTMPWATKLFPTITGYKKQKVVTSDSHDMIQTEAVLHEKVLNKDKEASDLMEAFLQEISKAGEGSEFEGKRGEKHMQGTLFNLIQTAAEAVTDIINWTLLYLILYPNVQDKLSEEISKVLGDNAPSGRDANRLPYTKAVIKEVFRITSLSSFANFHSTTRDVNFHNYLIPKDTLIIGNLYGIHHNEKYYPEPHIFKPERFLDGHDLEVKDAPYVPFSIGLRACIGQSFAKNQTFLFTVSLCQHFWFEWDPSVPKLTIEDLIDKSRVSIFRAPPKFNVLVRTKN